MHLRNPFKNGNRYPAYDPGYQTVGAVREDRALQEVQNIQEARDGMRVARRVPVRNQGYMMFPQDGAPLAPYPYPQHIPRAAAPRHEYHPQAIVPGGYLDPIPGEGPYRGVSMSFESMAKVLLTISVIVGTLCIWIFWREILKSGLIIGGFASSCYLLRLGWRAVLKYRDDDLAMQGTLFPPQQPQHYIIQQPPHELGIPGGW
jgi:hypothetical protein